MFVELYPLLQKRVVLLTADVLPGARIRVTVSQKPKDKDDKLPPYLSIEGTPEEVDAVLVQELTSHTETMVAFHSAVEELKASTEATLKEVKEAEAQRIAAAKNKGKSSAAVATTKTAPAAKPEPPKAPAAPSLFDTAPSPTEAVAPAVAAVASVATAETDENDNDDTDPDNEPDGSDDDEEASDDVSDDASAPAQTLVAATAVTEPAQHSMFAVPSSEMSEEEYQLQEAFNGGNSQSLAA